MHETQSGQFWCCLATGQHRRMSRGDSIHPGSFPGPRGWLTFLQVSAYLRCLPGRDKLILLNHMIAQLHKTQEFACLGEYISYPFLITVIKKKPPWGRNRQLKTRHGSVPIILPEVEQPVLRRSCLKKQTKAGLLAYICSPSSSGAEVGGLAV